MKSTKIMLIAAVAVGAMLACSSSLRAQESTNTPPAGQRSPGGMRGGMNLEQMAKTLELTDAQKEQIKPVLADQAKEMKELRADTSLSQEDRRAKMKTIREGFTAKMKAILTPEQFAKFEKMGPRHKAPPAGGAGVPTQN